VASAGRSASDDLVDASLSLNIASTLPVGPLKLRELHRLLAARLGRPLPRPHLVRLATASGGNPFFTLEIAAALDRIGAWPTPETPLPVPDRLRDLVAHRLAELSPDERAVLLLVAASPSPSAAAAALEASPDPRTAAVIEHAERAGLVAREGGLRTSHPLVGSVLYTGATTGERSAAHRALAELATTVEERARHLALASTRPDPEIAATLHAAGLAAAQRGAPGAAHELLELAVLRTPAPDASLRGRRCVDLARSRFLAGDAQGARKEATSVAGSDLTGPVLADALLLLAEVEHDAGGGAAAVARCQEALLHAGEDVALRARIHATLAVVNYDDFDEAARHAQRSLELLDSAPDPNPGTTVLALRGLVEAELLAGRGLLLSEAQHAVALERARPTPRVADRCAAALGAWLLWSDDLTGARQALEATHRAVIEEGDESSLPFAISHLPQLELRSGNWGRARAYAVDLRELAEATGQTYQTVQAWYLLGLVDAHLGAAELAREELATCLRLAADADADDTWLRRLVDVVLGFLALSEENLPEARRLLELADTASAQLHVRDPSQRREVPLLVEALVALGDLERAEEVLSEVAANQAGQSRPALRARLGRCRALVLAARGDLPGAVAAIEQALADHQRMRIPFEEAQTLLTLGLIERRRRHKAVAREAITAAIVTFAELGAKQWAERARRELERSGLHHGAPGALTPSEQRVAELAALGRTNREVAAALYLSHKTVEVNLARVYTKLGIRSRAELGRAMVTTEAPGSAKT